jgi:transcriptional regulator with XRE-family HTH domain
MLGSLPVPERRQQAPERLQEPGRRSRQKRRSESDNNESAAHERVLQRGASLGPPWSARAALVHQTGLSDRPGEFSPSHAVGGPMQRENLIARVFRALSGKSQKQTAEEMGVDPSLVARVELGEVAPDRKYLEALGRTAGHTAEDGEEILRFYDTLRQPRRRAGQGAEALTEGLAKEMEAAAPTARPRGPRACPRPVCQAEEPAGRATMGRGARGP